MFWIYLLTWLMALNVWIALYPGMSGESVAFHFACASAAALTAIVVGPRV